VHKTLSEFDFDFQPSLDRKVIAELSTLRFVEEKHNVILLGPPGVGKTHLAIALGIAATEVGYRTYFTSASDMVSSLQSAHLEGLSRYRMRTYTWPSVLVIDVSATCPSTRHPRTGFSKSSVVATRRPQSCLRPTAASAIGARSSPTASWLPPSSTASFTAPLVNVRGRSYRMRAHQDPQESKNGR
jgi:DNA replication protein DnaC